MEISLTFSGVFETPGIRCCRRSFDLDIKSCSSLFCQAYFYNDDTFNFNYAQAKAALGNYEEAEEVRRLIWNIYFLLILWSLLSCHGFWLLQFIYFSVFPADSEWKVQERLRLSELARSLLYVSKSWHVIISSFVCCLLHMEINSYMFWLFPEPSWRVHNLGCNTLFPSWQVVVFVIGTKTLPLLVLGSFKSTVCACLQLKTILVALYSR